MYKNGFPLGLAISSIMLLSLSISAFSINTSPLRPVQIGSLYQRDPDRTGIARASEKYRLDCFRRYYRFNQEESSIPEQKDVSNYFIHLS